MKDSRLLFLSRYDYEKVRRQLSADSLLYPVFLKRDFYEVALPRKNEQIHITPQNAEFLYRILTRYENRKVEYDNGKIYENGKELTSCRLTQSYYWVIGDNRAGMSDSRSFGVLPHSHLIGKGVCIGYSRNPEKPFWQSLRTDRFFIEIQQKFVPLLEERAYIVLVVFEKRGGPVSRSDSIPMQMPPLSVVGDTNVFRGAFNRVGFDDRDGQCQ